MSNYWKLSRVLESHEVKREFTPTVITGIIHQYPHFTLLSIFRECHHEPVLQVQYHPL